MYEFEKIQKQQNAGLLKWIYRKTKQVSYIQISKCILKIRVLLQTRFYKPVSEFCTFWKRPIKITNKTEIAPTVYEKCF